MRTYAAPIRAIPITVTSGMIVLIAISPVEGDEGVVFASPVVLPALLPLSADGVSGVDGVPGVARLRKPTRVFSREGGGTWKIRM